MRNEEIAQNLNERLKVQIDKLVSEQLEKIGGDRSKLRRKLYPDDPDALCSYEYDGRPILGVRIVNNGIMFDLPNLETLKGEVHGKNV